MPKKKKSYLPDNRDYEGMGRWSESQKEQKAERLAEHNVSGKKKRGKYDKSYSGWKDPDYLPTTSNVHNEEQAEGRKDIRGMMVKKMRKKKKIRSFKPKKPVTGILEAQGY